MPPFGRHINCAMAWEQRVLDIVYQDHDLLVANKPAQLLCVPGLSEPDNLYDRARALWPNLRVVHRLDMATSGLVVFALHYNAQRELSQLFAHRRVHKQYSAVVSGRIDADQGEIQLPLSCDWPNRPRQRVDWTGGKPAQTFFRVQHRYADRTHLHLFPVTGRSHQLRVHCQALGHPIVGDTFYGLPNQEARMLLHAERLQFIQPLSDQPLDLYSPAPFFNKQG